MNIRSLNIAPRAGLGFGVLAVMVVIGLVMWVVRLGRARAKAALRRAEHHAKRFPTATAAALAYGFGSFLFLLVLAMLAAKGLTAAQAAAFGALIGITYAAWRMGGNAVLTFWIGYILTRPFGAALGERGRRARARSRGGSPPPGPGGPGP